MGKLHVIGEGKEVRIRFGDKYESVLFFCDLVYFCTIYCWICVCSSRLCSFNQAEWFCQKAEGPQPFSQTSDLK